MSRRDKRNLAVLSVFFIIAAMVFVVADEVHLHIIVGLILVGLLAVHTIARLQKLLKCPSRIKGVDIMCLVSLVVMTASGFIIPVMKDNVLPLMIHKFSSVSLVLACIIHFAQHCKKKHK